MNNFISSRQLEDNSVLIRCGTDQGTGFFVSEDLLLTARHVVVDCLEEDHDILIKNSKYDSSAIVAEDQQLDVCLIKLNEKSQTFLPLSTSNFSYNQPCSVFGFPYADSEHGTHISGRINKIGVEEVWDFSFSDDKVNDEINYEGLSGGAVISREKAIGIVIRQQGKSILAISVRKISEWLIESTIEVGKEETLNEIPKSLKEQVEASTPNYGVMETLTDCLEGHSGWFLCHGSPGSGKTTFVAAYRPEGQKVKVLGRYFIKIPRDTQSPATRTSERSLISWIEDVVGETTGQPVDVLDKLEDRINRIPALLNLAGSQNSDVISTLFIDGLDEVTDLQGLLSIFPSQLPSNIAVVLSCTSQDILPGFVKSNLPESKIIEVTPLDIGQCEIYVREELKSKILSTEIIQEIALKSEGHPLYLQYLLNYIRSYESSLEELETWLNGIPSIEGNIANYYGAIWDRFFREEGKLWIVLLLSQLRSPVDQQTLLKVLPDNHKTSFYSNLEPISYLLKDIDQLELYHGSFKHFIIGKVPGFISLSNDNIAQFCSQEPEHPYSISHFLHHLTNSSRPDRALEHCNQQWADQCATRHVHPDLVIQDIKDVIGIALERKDANQVIRLLLLLQRISFRYDSVFAENAKSIAAALIAMEDYKAAVKYLVRGNTLLIDDEDAIDFLQLFYENQANEEGDILLNAFNTRYRYFIQEELGASDGFSLSPFIRKICASTLSMLSHREQGIEELEHTFHRLKGFQNFVEKYDNEEAFQAIYRAREMGISWHNGYAMRLYDGYTSVKERSEQSGAVLDEKWARIIGLSIIHFQELNRYNVTYVEKTASYLHSISDLEWLIDHHGYDEESSTPLVLIKALIKDSKRLDIIEPLIIKHLDVNGPDFPDIRQENGVDLSYQNVHAHYFNAICKGYTTTQDQLTELPNLYSRYRSWEKYYIDLLHELGVLEGLLTRKKVFGENFDSLTNRLHDLLGLTKLELEERSHWERSYLIPEDLLPVIFLKVTQLYTTFFPGSTDTLMEFIEENSRVQLGLYTEGYRENLLSVIEVLARYERFDESTLKVITLLEEHILEHVQNRWERTPGLIKVIEFYGLIGQKERASSTFHEMLKTSMGPSWYKEAQLQLLNTTFRVNSDDNSSDEYAKEFSAMLDHASGEMTFQRYIQYEKERLIGDLILKDKLDKGIEYLKFESIPPPATLIQNAERPKVDAIALGDGYVPGANNVTIQSGVLEILKRTKDLSPYIKVALCSIFTVNDEVFRYVDQFSQHMAEAFNDIDEKEHRTEVIELMINILDSEGMKDDRAGYIGGLASHMNPDYYEELAQAALTKKSWQLPIEKTKDNQEVDHKEQNSFVEFNELYSNRPEKVTRDLLLKQGIDSFKKERISIWYGNWSSAHRLTKENLKSIFDNSEETVDLLSPFIKEVSVEAWSVVDELLWFLDDKLSQDQIKQIYKDISAHFELLIRPDEYVFEKYDWIKEHKDSASTNVQLINFIIWLLNHPLDWIHDKAFEMLIFLGHFMPDDIISALIKESATKKPQISCMRSVEVLKMISIENPSQTKRAFEKSPKLLEIISTINHLSIFKNYLEIGKLLESSGYSTLRSQLENVLPDNIEEAKGVALEEDMLSVIEEEIDELNELKILNKEFCEDILNRVTSTCEPLSWQETRKSDRYLIRSYHEARYQYRGRYEEIASDALNRAIMNRASKNNIDQIFEIVNPY